VPFLWRPLLAGQPAGGRAGARRPKGTGLVTRTACHPGPAPGKPGPARTRARGPGPVLARSCPGWCRTQRRCT